MSKRRSTHLSMSWMEDRRMTDLSANQAVWTSKLKEVYGETVELEDEQGQSSIYDIIAEFEVGDRDRKSTRLNSSHWE